MPRAARVVRLLAALGLLLALSVSLVTGWGAVPFWYVPVLALAVAGSQVAAVHLQRGGHRSCFPLTESALAAGLVLGSGAWTVLAVGAGVVLAQRVRQQPRHKRDYDVAQLVVATALAQAFAGALGGGLLAAGAGMAVFWLVSDSSVALAVSLTSSRPFRSLVVSSAPQSALRTAGSCSIGLLAGYLMHEAPLGLLGLVVPLALLWSSYGRQSSHSAEARLFAELARGQERESVRSYDTSAQVVVTAAARLLGGADVELVLLAADGPVCFAGDETGIRERRRAGASVFDEPWVMKALGERSLSVGRDASRPYVSAVLGPSDSPLAVLRARRCAGATAFDRNELRLTEVLIGQAESWLSVAELADRPGAETPALVLLRESAHRLACLAESAGSVDDIVDELHLVEQAVACLLGATAATGTRPPPAVASAVPPRPRAADWTNTGVLS